MLFILQPAITRVQIFAAEGSALDFTNACIRAFACV